MDASFVLCQGKILAYLTPHGSPDKTASLSFKGLVMVTWVNFNCIASDSGVRLWSTAAENTDNQKLNSQEMTFKYEDNLPPMSQAEFSKLGSNFLNWWITSNTLPGYKLPVCFSVFCVNWSW